MCARTSGLFVNKKYVQPQIYCALIITDPGLLLERGLKFSKVFARGLVLEGDLLLEEV